MLLVDVVDAKPAAFPFLGIKIGQEDRIRTLVRGQAGDGWWTPRATRIAWETERAAKVTAVSCWNQLMRRAEAQGVTLDACGHLSSGLWRMCGTVRTAR